MGNKLTSRQRKAILWFLLIANMAAIFALSAQTADVSTDETDEVIALPKLVFDTLHPERANDYSVLELFRFIVRKTAHFMEFATLSVWIWLLYILYEKGRPFVSGAVLSSLYAASDEIHQIFVPGRTCKISDWCIDTAGAIAGVLVIWVLVNRTHRARMNDPIER